MFGIPIRFDQVQTALMSFFQTDGMTVMLTLVMATGIAGLLISALRSALAGKR